MSRVLIGWASRAGAASDIAAFLADEMRMMGHDVEVSDLKQTPDPSSRDLVVLGSGVQAGQYYPEALAWVTANEEALAMTNVAVFNVCLNAANFAKRDASLGYNKAMVSRLGPVAVESFAGRYIPDKVPWFKRLFLRTLQQSAQDHVDEEAVRAWGRDLAGLIAH
ncbi:MAG: flavodoxin domain-containing protein [Propionibacteriaceae bacterium]|nr:flavodoxin domain-containing protein [Propionibacteriaceae bacterium]